MRRILVHGYFGGRNFGDDLMLLGFLNRHVRPDDTVAIITPDGKLPAHLDARVARAYPKSAKGFLAGIAWATDFVLCGGTVFHDAYPAERHRRYHKNLIAVAGLLRFARLAGRRVLLPGIGLGPLTRPLTRATARIALRSAVHAGLRDERSLADAAAIGCADRVKFEADLSDAAGLVRCEGPRRGLTLSLVSPALISTTDTETAERFYTGLATALGDWQKRTGEPMTLLVICVGQADSDIAFAAQFQRMAAAAGATDLKLHPYDGDPVAMADRIGAARAMIAMRFHAATISEKFGTPTFWLAYQRKVIDGAIVLGAPESRAGIPDSRGLARIIQWLGTVPPDDGLPTQAEATATQPPAASGD